MTVSSPFRYRKKLSNFVKTRWSKSRVFIYHSKITKKVWSQKEVKTKLKTNSKVSTWNSRGKVACKVRVMGFTWAKNSAVTSSATFLWTVHGFVDAAKSEAVISMHLKASRWFSSSQLYFPVVTRSKNTSRFLHYYYHHQHHKIKSTIHFLWHILHQIQICRLFIPRHAQKIFKFYWAL